LIVRAQEVGSMATFSPAELDYLTSERRVGRLATADADGHLHVVPVGMWRVNSDFGTLDITGHEFARKRKFRNGRANPRAALVVGRDGKHRPVATAVGHGRGPGTGDDASPETRRKESSESNPRPSSRGDSRWTI
jgi:PPOX class F420-dependent enzyme/OxyR family protein